MPDRRRRCHRARSGPADKTSSSGLLSMTNPALRSIAFGAGPVRHPPVRVVAGIAVLDEGQVREAGPLEDRRLGERVILLERLLAGVAALHRLADEQVLRDMLADQVERQQRMAQMVEHAQKQHEVEALAERADVVDRELREFDVEPGHLGGETRLRQIVLVVVDRRARGRRRAVSSRSSRSPPLQPISSTVLPAQVVGHRMREAPPFDRGIVAEEMVGRGLHAAEIDIVKPRAERRDLARGAGRASGSASALVPPANCSGATRRVSGDCAASASSRIASR